MKRIVVFIYEHFKVGGAELLIERLAQGYRKSGCETFLFCNSCDETMIHRLQNNCIELFTIAQWKDQSSFRKAFNRFKQSEILCFTFFWSEYSTIKGITCRNIKTILYAVHFKALAVGVDNLGLGRTVRKILTKRKIQKGAKERSIICMDEQTGEFCKNYYGYNNWDYEIVRLPYPVKQYEKHIRTGNNILAIARCELPFKGYLVGLIDVFNHIKKKFCNATLTIVSYGDDIDCLRSKIETSINKKDIFLVGKTDFNSLEEYFQKAALYIGMGTTILDASVRGIPSLAVRAYTENVIADKWFFSSPNYLAVPDNVDVIQGRVENYIEELFSFDEAQYDDYSVKSKEAVVNNYSLSIAMEKLASIEKQLETNRFDLFFFGISLLRKFKHAIRGNI